MSFTFRFYCKGCGRRLFDDSAITCVYCGYPLRLGNRAKENRPYRLPLVLGLIGSILGYIIFAIALFNWIDILVVSSYKAYKVASLTVMTLTSQASFILGFIGAAKINQLDFSGGKFLILGAAFSIISALLNLEFSITLIYSPFLLSAGIITLIKKRRLTANKLLFDTSVTCQE